MGATIRADSSSDRTAELLWAHEYGQRRPNKFVELYIPVGFWYVARRLTLEISSHPLFLPVSPPLEVAFCGLVLCQLSRRGYSRKLRSLTSRTTSPTPISGFLQTWCTYGGLAGTINVSNGTPTGNCSTNGVFYPTPLFNPVPISDEWRRSEHPERDGAHAVEEAIA